MVGGQTIGHFFVYNTHVTIVAAGNRIGCIICLVNGSWGTIPRLVWVKDSGINEFKIRCCTKRTQRRSGGRSISCIALAGWAARCNTAGVGGRTRISAEGEVGLRLDYHGLFMRINCLQTLIWGVVVLELNFLQLWLLSLLIHTCWFFSSSLPFWSHFSGFPNAVSQFVHIV